MSNHLERIKQGLSHVKPANRQNRIIADLAWAVAEIERLRRDYVLFEEMAPPDVPRSVFVKQCFNAWEKIAEAGKQ